MYTNLLLTHHVHQPLINTLRLNQNGHNFADDTLKCIFLTIKSSIAGFATTHPDTDPDLFSYKFDWNVLVGVE